MPRLDLTGKPTLTPGSPPPLTLVMATLPAPPMLPFWPMTQSPRKGAGVVTRALLNASGMSPKLVQIPPEYRARTNLASVPLVMSPGSL